jgi:hypothetical protein
VPCSRVRGQHGAVRWGVRTEGQVVFDHSSEDFICATRRFQTVRSLEVKDLDEVGQTGPVGLCQSTVSRTGHRPCLLGRCLIGLCRARLTAFRPGPSTAWLVLRAGRDTFPVVLYCARAGPNRVGRMQAQLTRTKFSGVGATISKP